MECNRRKAVTIMLVGPGNSDGPPEHTSENLPASNYRNTHLPKADAGAGQGPNQIISIRRSRLPGPRRLKCSHRTSQAGFGRVGGHGQPIGRARRRSEPSHAKRGRDVVYTASHRRKKNSSIATAAVPTACWRGRSAGCGSYGSSAYPRVPSSSRLGQYPASRRLRHLACRSSSQRRHIGQRAVRYGSPASQPMDRWSCPCLRGNSQ